MIVFLAALRITNMVLRSTAAPIAVSLMLAATNAIALTCAYEPLTLEESYARAEGIIVGQVLGCADAAVPQDGRCPEYRYHLETIEVLKDPQPWQNYSGTYQGADGMTRCGQGFALGESYLLFLDGSGSIITSAGGLLNDEYPQSRGIMHRLETLRDYRAGRLHELAEPWIFTDNGSSCGLEHSVLGQQITFGYVYDVPQVDGQFRIQEDADGNTRVTSRTPQQTPMGAITTELVGPKIENGRIFLTVNFDQRLKTERDTATISVGDQSWHLKTQDITIRRDGEVMISHAQEFTQGDPAEAILRAMLEPSDVTATKRAGSPIVRGVDPISVNRAEDTLIETRSTQLARHAEQFIACSERTSR